MRPQCEAAWKCGRARLSSTAMMRKVASPMLDQFAALDDAAGRASFVPPRRRRSPSVFASDHVRQIRAWSVKSDGAITAGQRSSTAFSSISWRSPVRAALKRIGHGAHGNGLGDAARGLKERAFLRHRAGDAPDSPTTSPPSSTWPWSREPVRKASLSDSTPAIAAAQEQAEKEDAEALRAAAQFAPRKRRREPRCDSCAPGHAFVRHNPAVLQPHDARAALRQRFFMRHQKQRGAALAHCSAKRRSAMPRPSAPSRLPVGSSANRICGRGAMARASATRCCSPPDNCPG